jgi:Ca2+-binding RTX toxin-like protein
MAIVANSANMSGTSLDDFIVGMTANGGQTTANAGAGADLIYGDQDVIVATYNDGNTFQTAYDMTGTPGIWSLAADPNIDLSTEEAHVSAQIVTDGNYEWFAFTLEEGQFLTIDVDGGITGVDGVDTRIRVYGEDGTTMLATNDDMAELDTGSTSLLDANLTVEILEAGTYYVRISDFVDDAPLAAGDSFTVNFSLSGQDVPVEPAHAGYINPKFMNAPGNSASTAFDMTATAAYWTLSENEDIGNATTIPHATAIVEGNGEAQWYAFSLDAGQKLTVDIDYGNHEIGGSFNSKIWLYASNGTTLLSSNDTGTTSFGGFGSTSSQDANLTYTAATAGTYYIRIGESDGSGADVGEDYVAHFSLTGQEISSTPTSRATDLLNGGDGNDIIYGQGGHDTINGEGDIDKIYGGAGNDILDGGAGKDQSFGGAGNDTFRMTAGDFFDDVYGGSETDLIELAASTIGFNIDLEAQTMAFVGNTFASNGMYKVVGVENVNGTAQSDTITGNYMNNVINSGNGVDTVNGGDGNDTINTGAGADQAAGGKGNDTYLVSDSSDTIIETSTGGTTDRVLTTGNFTLAAGVSVEVVSAADTSLTTAMNLTGNALKQTIIGNAGANTLTSGTGAGDVLQGGNGNDIYIVNNAADTITEGSTQGTSDTARATVDYVLGAQARIEVMSTNNAGGTSGIDLTGNSFVQSLTGNAGHNKLNSMGGADTMTGGSGDDSFIFTTAISNTTADTVTDFNVADDTFHIDNAVFKKLTAGALSANAFVSNTTGNASTADHRIIYDNNDGKLYFDVDGNGAGAKILFANVDTGLALTSADFLVI